MNHSPELDKLGAALVAAQAEMPDVPKDGANGHFKGHRFTTLDTLIHAIRPELAKHGLTVIQHPAESPAGYMAMTTMLIHESGQFVSHTMTFPMDKPTPQGAGGAITYMRRYSLASMLFVSGDTDDDGNIAEASVGTSKSMPAPSQPSSNTAF